MSCKSKKPVIPKDQNQKLAEMSFMNAMSEMKIPFSRKRKVDATSFSYLQHEHRGQHRFPMSGRQTFEDDNLCLTPRLLQAQQQSLSSQQSHAFHSPQSINSRFQFPYGTPTSHLSDRLALSESQYRELLHQKTLNQYEILPIRSTSLGYQHFSPNQDILPHRMHILNNPLLQQHLIDETGTLRLTQARRVLEDLMVQNAKY